MDELGSLRRLAIAGSTLAIIVSVPSTIAFVAAFGWDVEASIFGEPGAILGRGPEAAALLRWGAVGDMFYSYLLLIPLVLFLHRRLRPNRPWLADLGTLCGLAYIFVGGAAAATLAIAGSSLVDAYSKAAPADQPAIATSFELVRNVVFFAVWQMLDALTLGAWVASVGVLLYAERPLMSRLLVVLGVATMSASVMSMVGVHSIALILLGLAIALLLWVAWVAFDRPSRLSSSPEP
jgi:hypothetical protein